MSRFIIEDAADINYKNLRLLKRCLTEGGKIVPARLTGLSRSHQRLVEQAIKQARVLALIPYSVN